MRCEGHITDRRVAKRHTYVGLVLICVPLNSESDSSETPAEAIFEVWSRNLSASGMSFIIPPDLVPAAISDATPMLKIDRTLREGLTIRVGLPKPSADRVWLNADIMRVRPIHDGLIECGVHFTGRAEPPDTANLSSTDASHGE